MRRFHVLCLGLLVAGGLAVAAGGAYAESSPLADCTHNERLTGHYSVTQLRNALATMPETDQEYSNCYTVIQDQLNRQLAGLKTGTTAADTSSGGSFLSSPLLIVLIVIVLAGGGFALSARKRGDGGGGTPPPPAGSP